MRKSAILLLSLGPIVTGCMHHNPPSTLPATTQPAVATAVAPEPVGKSSPATTVQPTPTPPPAVWDGPVDGRPVFMRLRGEGVQIYECKKTDSGFAWDLKSPEALLYNDKGRNVGKIAAGPTITMIDGSTATGEKVAESPQPGKLALALFKITGETGNGKLKYVKYIERVDTDGGTPPTTPADADHVGKTENVPYRATYVLYAGG